MSAIQSLMDYFRRLTNLGERAILGGVLMI